MPPKATLNMIRETTHITLIYVLLTTISSEHTFKTNILDRSEFNLIFIKEPDQPNLGETITISIEQIFETEGHENISQFDCNILIQETRPNCIFLNELLVFYNNLSTKAVNISKSYINIINELPAEQSYHNRSRRDLKEFGATQAEVALLQHQIGNMELNLQGEKSLLLQDIAIEAKQLNNLYRHIKNTNGQIFELARDLAASKAITISQHWEGGELPIIPVLNRGSGPARVQGHVKSLI